MDGEGEGATEWEGEAGADGETDGGLFGVAVDLGVDTLDRCAAGIPPDPHAAPPSATASASPGRTRQDPAVRRTTTSSLDMLRARRRRAPGAKVGLGAPLGHRGGRLSERPGHSVVTAVRMSSRAARLLGWIAATSPASPASTDTASSSATGYTRWVTP